MADIRPFQGVHYNPLVAGDAGKVICPPYDVISPQFQDDLYAKNDNNFVRVEFGREYPQDTEQENRYTRAASTLSDWLTRGILTTDSNAAIYVDDHHFTVRGTSYCRRNLNCLIRLEEWESKVVRPHEAIFSRAKSDRLNLIYALQANTSPIMALYQDPNRSISLALSGLSSTPALFTADTGGGESHELRAVTDATAIQTICGVLADRAVYIADGHHRYESALTYQRERRARVNTPIGTEPYDYVMITLVDFDDPGLVILPAHRLVRHISPAALNRLTSGLAEFFSVRSVPIETGREESQAEDLLKEHPGEPVLVLHGLEPGFFQVLTMQDTERIDSTMPYFHTPDYRRLDVSILDHVIFETLLGLNADSFGAHISYTTEPGDVLQRVNAGEYQFSVLVNPVSPEVIMNIANNGDRMPRKSTYFYPKIPAGLVIYRFT